MQRTVHVCVCVGVCVRVTFICSLPFIYHLSYPAGRRVLVGRFAAAHHKTQLKSKNPIESRANPRNRPRRQAASRCQDIINSAVTGAHKSTPEPDGGNATPPSCAVCSPSSRMTPGLGKKSIIKAERASPVSVRFSVRAGCVLMRRGPTNDIDDYRIQCVSHIRGVLFIKSPARSSSSRAGHCGFAKKYTPPPDTGRKNIIRRAFHFSCCWCDGGVGIA